MNKANFRRQIKRIKDKIPKNLLGAQHWWSHSNDYKRFYHESIKQEEKSKETLIIRKMTKEEKKKYLKS